MKKWWLKIWPKLLVCAVGSVIFGISFCIKNTVWQSFLINISSGLIVVPLLLILYEIWENRNAKKLNETVFEYVENEVGKIMLKCKSITNFLEIGIANNFAEFDQEVDAYFNEKKELVLELDENNQIIVDEDGEGYLKKNQIESEEEEIDLKYQKQLKNKKFRKQEFEFELSGKMADLANTYYFGYQVLDFEVSDIIEDLSKVANNSFMMERIDSNQSAIIINMLDCLKIMQTFIDFYDDLFVETDIVVKNITVERLFSENKTAMFSICYTDGKYNQVIEKNMYLKDEEEKLTKIYVLNPDFLPKFCGVVTDMLSCLYDWRETCTGFVLNHEEGKIEQV